MKESQILFTAPMVRACLDGTKTQTRRVINCTSRIAAIGTAADWDRWKAHPAQGTPRVVLIGEDGMPFSLPCPYGGASDRLICRETFYAWGRWETRFNAKKGRDEWHFVDMTLECGMAYQYPATGDRPQPVAGRRDGGTTPKWWKRPAIFMPRMASRLTLEITEVRPQMLQDISEADAVAEGIAYSERFRGYCVGMAEHFNSHDPRQSYLSLWDAINGAGEAQRNPAVWAITFRREATP